MQNTGKGQAVPAGPPAEKEGPPGPKGTIN